MHVLLLNTVNNWQFHSYVKSLSVDGYSAKLGKIACHPLVTNNNPVVISQLLDTLLVSVNCLSTLQVVFYVL